MHQSKSLHVRAKKTDNDDLAQANLVIGQEHGAGDEREVTPRRKFINKKFKTFDEDEVVLDNFACAASFKLLLQGMMYITNKNVYFYSPFNKKTMLGRGTKIKMSYSAITQIKKESAILVFPNSIRFILKSQEEIVFTSFVSRDTCFSLILKQLEATSANKSLKANTRAERIGDGITGKLGKSKSKDNEPQKKISPKPGKKQHGEDTLR